MTPNQIVRRHYGLDRPVTDDEVTAEVANIKRRGMGNLDDSLERLAAALNVFKIVRAHARRPEHVPSTIAISGRPPVQVPAAVRVRLTQQHMRNRSKPIIRPQPDRVDPINKVTT